MRLRLKVYFRYLDLSDHPILHLIYSPSYLKGRAVNIVLKVTQSLGCNGNFTLL